MDNGVQFDPRYKIPIEAAGDPQNLLRQARDSLWRNRAAEHRRMADAEQAVVQHRENMARMDEQIRAYDAALAQLDGSTEGGMG